jgi:tetratricopeptide (TPR) repeat protein
VTYLQLGNQSQTVEESSILIESAVAEFEAARDLDPDDSGTRYQLGAAYLTMAILGSAPTGPADPELLEQAVVEFETALELQENMPEALIGMGNVYIQQGDYAAAIEALQQAIEQAPDSPQAYYALGEAYARSGDTSNACEAYARFLEQDPPAGWKSLGEQVMASLGCQ